MGFNNCPSGQFPSAKPKRWLPPAEQWLAMAYYLVKMEKYLNRHRIPLDGYSTFLEWQLGLCLLCTKLEALGENTFEVRRVLDSVPYRLASRWKWPTTPAGLRARIKFCYKQYLLHR